MTAIVTDRSRAALPVALLVLMVLSACLVLDRPLVRGDGLAYFMWLDSAARDWDLDLTNQAAKFAQVNTYQVFRYEKTGRYVSVFPFGSSLLLVPFYWLGTWADRSPFFHVNDAYFVQHQGVTLAFSLFAMFGANLYALATVLLTYFTARRWSSQWPAFLAAVALFFGTPLWYYATVEPLSAHVAGAFAVSLTLWLLACWWSPQGRMSPWREGGLWLGAGLAMGLATLVRWQLALFALPLAGLLIHRRRLRLLLPFGAGFAALAAWVPLSWWRMFGSPFVIPAAEQNRMTFLVWPTYLAQVLFSGEKGLFVWAPLTALALLGLVVLYRTERSLSVALAVAFALQALINASVYDWWAGWGFGMRRMVELYPVFALGLALLINGTAFGGRRRAWSALAHLLTVLCVAWSVLLLFSHLNFVNTVLDRPQGDTAGREVRHQLFESNWEITRLVIEQHYGPWAWRQPGP
jgi:hypothetical protein